MKTEPFAKINLGLYVTERRADGFHNIETIFYPIPIHDELEVEEADMDSFELDGIALDCEPMSNLVIRALYALREDYPVPYVNVRLTKNIPSGAGLGGGSSDAAFMMKTLNQMFNLGMSTKELQRRVSKLGADCAFFIECKPVMATGIGNVFESIDLDLSGFTLILVKPDDFISTREAYASITPKEPLEKLMKTMERSVPEWREWMLNDFEASTFPDHPVVAGIKERLYKFGAQYASMSGSGSSVFGLFRNKPDNMDEIREAFKEHFFYTGQL